MKAHSLFLSLNIFQKQDTLINIVMNWVKQYRALNGDAEQKFPVMTIELATVTQ